MSWPIVVLIPFSCTAANRLLWLVNAMMHLPQAWPARTEQDLAAAPTTAHQEKPWTLPVARPYPADGKVEDAAERNADSPGSPSRGRPGSLPACGPGWASLWIVTRGFRGEVSTILAAGWRGTSTVTLAPPD